MQLKNWLENPLKNYSVGLELLIKYNAPNALINTCKLLADTEIGFKKIIDFLEKIEVEEKKILNEEKVDATYVRIQNAWKDKYKKANYHFQNDLDEYTDIEQRRKAAQYILNAFENEIEPLWKEADHYKKTGQLKENNYFKRIEEKEKSLTIYELIKKRNSTRTLISKYKKNIEKSKKVKELELEIIELDKKINAF
jgi:hypothetical protein